MYSTPRYAASETITTFAIVSARIIAAERCWAGSFKSSRGQRGAAFVPRAFRRFRSTHEPSGIRKSPNTKRAGTIRKNTIPMIRVGVKPEQIGEEDQQEQYGADRRQHNPENGDRAVNHPNVVAHPHALPLLGTGARPACPACRARPVAQSDLRQWRRQLGNKRNAVCLGVAGELVGRQAAQRRTGVRAGCGRQDELAGRGNPPRLAMKRHDLFLRPHGGVESVDCGARLAARHLRVVVNEKHRTERDRLPDLGRLPQVDNGPLA